MIYHFSDYARQDRFRADVLVIGTGAGGATAGTVLAEAGQRVVFAEEGAYHTTQTMNPYARESIPRLYRDAGTTVILGRPPIPYAEGRTVGGSTVVNGGMCWRTPEDVLDGWSQALNAPDLSARGMEGLFERVEGWVSAKHQSPVSRGDDSRLMAAGARAMGWKMEANRRNQDRCVGANNCIYGCPTGAKQSTLVSMMPRAMRAGARCLTEVRIDRLVIEGGRCVGAAGHAIDPRTRRPDYPVTIRAKAVIVACGAVQTPYLLLRHRVARRSRQLGRNFVCHPNAKVLAVYPHEVKAWQGVSQWGQIRQFHDEGIVLAENFVQASALGANLPVHGAAAWDLMRRYNNMVLSGVLVEDSTSGTISRAPGGLALARYDITDYDHTRFLKGIRRLAHMHLELGADEVILPFTNLHRVRSHDDLKHIETTQHRPDTLELFTPHLMCTARMGSDPKQSVVDLEGRIWDLPGCYVADASVFPSAIGVNPQITIMALATRVAERLAERLMAVQAAA